MQWFWCVPENREAKTFLLWPFVLLPDLLSYVDFVFLLQYVYFFFSYLKILKECLSGGVLHVKLPEVLYSHKGFFCALIFE